MIKRIYRKLFPLKAAINDGMQIGKGVSLVSPRTVTFGTEPYLIKLGDYVRISGNVMFTTHDGGTWAFRHHERYKHVFKYGSISVGDYTFIGANSIILPGVKIGNNCVVGVGSVVTKDIPDNSVVGGVPAHIITSTEEYADKCLKSMPEGIDLNEYYKNKKETLIKNYLVKR